MVSNELLLEMYEKMVLVREFEERAAECFSRGLVWASLHTCIGEEGTVVGSVMALEDKDYIQLTHRGHGHAITKGADINRMVAELFGKKTGLCKGKSGSMHIADFKAGILGANGIVSAGNPLAIGAGFAAQYRGTDQVAVSYFGDGASNQGFFHESVNLAAAWKLPVIFVNHNNQFAISTPFKTVSNTINIADRAIGYNIPGVIVDGMDPVAVYEAMTEAVQRARNGEGPTLIESKTYRFVPHSRSDREVYRTREEVEEWKKKDPIKTTEEKLIAAKLLNNEKIKEIHDAAKVRIEEAIEFGKNSPEPDVEDLYEDIYCEEV